MIMLVDRMSLKMENRKQTTWAWAMAQGRKVFYRCKIGAHILWYETEGRHMP